MQRTYLATLRRWYPVGCVGHYPYPISHITSPNTILEYVVVASGMQYYVVVLGSVVYTTSVLHLQYLPMPYTGYIGSM